MALSLTGALGWLGRRGTGAVALSAFAGMVLPGLSALARPFVQEAIFALLVLAFLKVDQSAVVARLRRPGLVLAASLWMMLALPAGAALLASAAGLREAAPDLAMALFIVTAAPAIMSSPAFMYFLKLDGALSLTVLTLSMLLVPLTAPFTGYLILGEALPLDSLTLGLKLFGLLAGSMAVAALLRRLAGEERIADAQDVINGGSVLLLFFFAIAVMDGVAASFANRPLMSLGIALLTYAVTLTQAGLTMLVFAPALRSDAFVIAYSAGNRNMGLMVAALGGTLPDLAWLYFGLGQLPIYTLPYLVRPLARRLTAKHDAKQA
jgi:BASS family bile acid:Na+ symporter